jgi:hypothetical protein
LYIRGDLLIFEENFQKLSFGPPFAIFSPAFSQPRPEIPSFKSKILIYIDISNLVLQ